MHSGIRARIHPAESWGSSSTSAYIISASVHLPLLRPICYVNNNALARIVQDIFFCALPLNNLFRILCL
ncbi:hypothetical protein ACM14_13555 [Delftia sp. JD2]|nr:hypothetical protein ACM14_13555 [Delftia sp. JD2]